jgi:LytS/YehU family sensor histidine kinase
MHQKKVGQYLAWATLLILVVSVLSYFIQNNLAQQHLDHRSKSNALALRIISTTCLVGISSAYRFIEEWLQDRETERQQLETELKFLKSQVNPHFLFNSLNNIYSLSYRNDPNTPKMVALLSEIMRYMLYDCGTARVKLNKEIKLLENYIQLQHLNQQQKLNTDFYHEGILEGHQIAPMILINFVENAFKHSGIKDHEKAWISIELYVEKEVLHFKIENSQQSISPSETDGGIGLQNALRQLELNYPNRHKIEIENSESLYSLVLSIELSSLSSELS